MPMLMVAHAIANRFRKHWGTWEYLFDHIAQYSAKLEPPDPVWPHPMDVAWSRLLNEVDGIYEGTSPDPTNPARTPNAGACYWGDLNTISNPWFQAEILHKPEEHKRVASNASLVFFT